MPKTSILINQKFNAYEVARHNVDLDYAALHAHIKNPDTTYLRFQNFLPTVLVGVNQAFEPEVRESYCERHEIATLRRPSCGGAIYLDDNHFCFSLITNIENLGFDFTSALENSANLVAKALENIGVKSHFKAPNDLENSKSQKIASVFGKLIGNSFYVFVSIIKNLDMKTTMQALLVPTEKLTVTGLETASGRMTSLNNELGCDISDNEIKAIVSQIIGTHFSLAEAPSIPLTMPDDFGSWRMGENSYETKDKNKGATLRLNIAYESDNVRAIKFATDGHFTPDDALKNLCKIASGHSITELPKIAKDFFDKNRIEFVGFNRGDIEMLIKRALAKWEIKNLFQLNNDEATSIMLAGENIDANSILETASVMLVPYCAKPNWCKWRHTIDCIECGKCEVGDAYKMARERNLEVVTIMNYEHLVDTLGKMKKANVSSYVGMCCGEFFLKRHHAFRDCGMDAVLIDIEGANCYELNEEHLAYQGTFKAEAMLDLPIVEKIMNEVPVRDIATKTCITGLIKRPHEIYGPKHDCSFCNNNKKRAQ